MFDHFGIIVRNAAQSLRFYEAALAALGIRRIEEQPQNKAAVFMRPEQPDRFIWVGEGSAGPNLQRKRGEVHLCFTAPDRAAVEAFHAAAVRAGGIDNGGPGWRGPGERYYAAYVFDPDGNNVEAAWRVPNTPG